MKFIIALALTTLITSCNFMDDQTIVRPERNYLANPTPKTRDFARINAQHKILVGIVDSGVDYNQPYLFENLHFEVNRLFSWPTRFGYDLSGEDNWASPNIARTGDHNPELPPAEREKFVTEVKNIEQLLRENPEFSRFLHPLRNNAQEIQAGAYHGTHVAGLASYDSPEIGIIGYRVIPFSLKFKAGVPVSGDLGDALIEQILKASTIAVKDGVRVINMSLGLFVQRDHGSEKQTAIDEQKQKVRVAKLRAFALANPNVVFVVAAGNDGKWVDQDTRLGLPCGTDAPNILCVGAADKDGRIASFSNILMTEGAFVFGYGVNVLSTMPESMCTSSAVTGLAGSADTFKNQKSKDNLVKTLKDECSGSLALKELSGTSMASPIIARQVAKILVANSNLTGAEAIQTLLSKANPYKIGRVTFSSIRVEKPSWYPKNAKEGLSLLKDSYDFENDFFEFMVQQPQ